MSYLSSYVSIIYFQDYSHYFALLKVTSLRGDRVPLVIYSQCIDLMKIDVQHLLNYKFESDYACFLLRNLKS